MIWGLDLQSDIPLYVQIRDVRLIDAIPEGLFCINALGSQHLYSGSFRAEGMDDLRLAFPQNCWYTYRQTTQGGPT